MVSQMLPWFVATLLIGIVLGLVVGIFLASTLVRGHYSHFLSHTQPLTRQAPTQQNQYRDSIPYDESRNYPR